MRVFIQDAESVMSAESASAINPIASLAACSS
jgi:hypothetical protein